jgi:hypothetical protein
MSVLEAVGIAEPPKPDHLEGGPDCRWYKVKVTEELFAALGARVEWGRPDDEGFYTPVIRKVEP